MSKIYQILSENFKDIEKYYNDIPKGKGIRSKLVLAINPEAEILAASIEGLHLASLLHDDIIDEANFRRGKESINYKYGDKYAVMIGDILYSKSLSELAKVDKKVLEIVSNSIYLLSLGELEDVDLSREFNDNEEKYLSMIYKKTSALIEAACEASAYLKGYDSKKFAVYGKNLGMAFQIVDDILDIVGDSKTLGKPAMNDFKEGKVTLPYIYLYNKMNLEDKKLIKSYFKKELKKDEIEWILSQMKKYDVIDLSYQYSKKLAKVAKKAIEEYKITELEELLDRVICRNF